MKSIRYPVRLLLAALLLASVAPQLFSQNRTSLTAGEVISGQLAASDTPLANGKLVDWFTITVPVGRRLVVDLRSSAFDTYLLLEAPGQAGQWIENDDAAPNDTAHSHLEAVAWEETTAGTWRVGVTSYQTGDSGAYTLQVALLDAPPAQRLADDTVRGKLAQGDTMVEGRASDYWLLPVSAGTVYRLRLEANGFDPVLVLQGPTGQAAVNDDFEDSPRISQAEVIASVDGLATVRVHGYGGSDLGAYSLTVTRVEGQVGTLADGDEARPDGEFIDWYSVTLEAGQMLNAQLDATSFDTYLIIEDPAGLQEENDDAETGNIRRSRLAVNGFVGGVYRVGVTSYEAGETGAYSLILDTVPGIMPRAIAASGSIAAAFAAGDTVLSGGQYADGYSFHANSGDIVIVRMNSTEVDPLLRIKGPGPMVAENDDADGTLNSMMAFRARQTGDYYLTATTFRASQAGSYSLVIDLQASKYEAGDWAVGQGGRIYGVFVGISEYEDPDSNLEYCADDARRVRDAYLNLGMRPDDGILLVDADATADNIRNKIRRVAALAGANDMFVFFYSGHGDQQARGRPDAIDPDGLDEIISVYDGDITDDELAALLDASSAGCALVVMDSCHSGGFARDVVSRPGRIGFFSSESDSLSMVAKEADAGGWLSLFFAEAFEKDRALVDLNGDRMMTVHELTFYLQERYRTTVNGQQSDDVSLLFASGPIDPEQNPGFQRLVADREGVSPHLILMDW
ncbi:MAG: hypothetical protein A2087_00205 [Spirochaetes bacterium GWD1_61_31]|nr:MAG: hypothetical protein A2087_00205 [Spirochaetes bacterium GWD1_61_31]OHD42394.1 MAG: hypothetical protein A2Y35_00445 [Spirochaetes bacterium GWE1_60_18]OHD58156.1 MAG: hypothetical protein A2Y32_01350 [Spirochaetes bacterium GWF1_60_12]HAP43970.1 hypothetical protein [Spirochaetaceae bacterium]HAW85004.1 hypothetical protein [Spirochaetaceae bacterium]